MSRSKGKSTSALPAASSVPASSVPAPAKKRKVVLQTEEEAEELPKESPKESPKEKSPRKSTPQDEVEELEDDDELGIDFGRGLSKGTAVCPIL